MAFDILDTIREQERKAEALLHEAQQSANEIVKNAETQAADAERKAAIAHRALYQRILEDRRIQVEQALQADQAQVVEQTRQEVQQASARLPDAVDYIVKEVLHGRR